VEGRGRLKLRNTPFFVVINWVSSCFDPLFPFFPERIHSRCIYFHCSYLYNYYNYVPQTLCIKCWVSAFHTQIEIKLLYFAADVTQRGHRGWKAAQRQGEDRVTLKRTLICELRCDKMSVGPVYRPTHGILLV